jgi:hypothetical protein
MAPQAPVADEFQKKQPPMAAMGEVPDVADNADPVSAWHRNLLRARLTREK